jgi:two-component system chemotaxis response regulator CheB
MPARFTHALAQRLDESSPLTVQEAGANHRLARGLVLLAPGDHHLQLNGNQLVRLDQGPRRNGVRPSLDVSMETAAAHYGSSVIGVILTGMGSDGTIGARAIKAAGGTVIVEHQQTSVVHGMPGSAVEAGLADHILPLPEIAPALVRLVNRD